MPKIVDHVRYRKELLARCFDLFAQSGYGTLTMRQIAEALEVSTGTLYHYFPTKEALFQQLVEEVTQRTIFEASALLRQQEAPEERLMALFRFLAEHEDDLRKQMLVTLNYYQHQDLYGKTAGRVLQAGGDRYSEAIRCAIGLTDPQLCFTLESQIQGLLLLRMLYGIKTPFIEQARPFVRLFAEQIRNATSDNQTS